MTTIFQDTGAKERIRAWYERFHSRLSVPTESREVDTRFGSTHVLIGGPEDAPPLILLHGALASSAHASVELEPLYERFRVHAVDVIGQSVMSAEVRLPVDDDSYGQWLLDVFDALALPRAHLVAVSWGGFVALRLAALAPERIERLALLVPAGLIPSPFWEGFTRFGWPMLVYRMFPSEERFKAALRGLLTTPDPHWSGYLKEAFAAFRMSFKEPTQVRPGELSGLRAPTLLVAADRDMSFPGQAMIERAKELIPSLEETELLEQCNHCPPTTPEFRGWLGARIRRFLLAEPSQELGVAAE